jgi:Ca-activated chloride channel family protein
MTKHRPAIVAALVLVLSIGFVIAQDQSLRVAVNLVLLDVSVTDKTGHYVRDLQQENFKVYEDKLEQPISYFNTGRAPVSWGVVLDRSGSMSGDTKEVYDAAVHMINEGTTEDEMFVLTFSRRIDTVTEFTTDRRKLQDALFGLHSQGSTALFDAVGAAVDQLKQGRNRRKALVVITDGEDNHSVLTFKQLLDRVRESDVVIYTVGLKITMGSFAQARIARNQLEELAQITGGYVHFPKDIEHCRKTMEEIAQEVSEHYTIGYYPTNAAYDGKWRRLHVVASNSSPEHAKYIARTRTGYFGMPSSR